MAKKHLVVHIDRNSVKFERYEDDQSTLSFHFNFTDKTDFGYKNQLDAFLTKTEFRTMEWDEYSLSWFSEKSTLLPYSFFGTVDTTKAFQLSFGSKVDEGDIDFNRIPEHTLVNLFEIPQWVKSFFIVRFPRLVIQHSGTHAIRGLFNGSAYSLKIVLLPFQDHFTILAVKDNDLKFYNTYDYQSKEDLFYHTAHVIQQHNWKNEKGKLQICEALSEQKLFDQLNADWQKIELFKNLKLEHLPDLMSKNQLLCV